MSTNFFSPKNCAVYETVWKKYGRDEQATDDNLIWHMHFACWLPKATDTHSESVIFNAFIWQQWLQEPASVLHLYVYYLSCLSQPKPYTGLFFHISLSYFHNLVTFCVWKFSPYIKSVPSIYTMPLMLQ